MGIKSSRIWRYLVSVVLLQALAPTMAVGAPATPASLTQPAVVLGTGSFSVSWSPVSGTNYYHIAIQHYDSDDWDVYQVSSSKTSKTFTKSVGAYEFRVRACSNSTGCSAYLRPRLVTVVSSPTLLHSEAGIVSASAAGETDAVAYVDEKGNARIDVPLRLPNGVNGLAPVVGLTYSSGAIPRLDEEDLPGGLLGHGWDLVGIPAISTCSGGLCLNGQRLAVISGSGATAVYKTELDSFVKVTTHGSLYNRYFKVYLPDGQVWTLGDTSASRVRVPQGDDYVWSISVQEDAFGNKVYYNYDEIYAGGTHVIRSITYEGAEIHFRYASRCPSSSQCDVETVDGALDPETAVQPLFLNRILTKVNGKWVNDYRLDNNFDGDDFFRLDKLQHCAYNESGSTSKCMGAMEFKYHKFMVTDTATSTTEPQLAIDEFIDSYGDTTYFDASVINGSGSSNHALHVDRHTDFPDKPLPSGVGTSTRQRVVVSQLRTPDGDGGTTTTVFRYQDYPLYSSSGRGFLGFKSVRTEFQDHRQYNGSTGSFTASSRTYRQYRFDFPFTGRVARQINYMDTNSGSGYTWTLLSRQVVDYASQYRTGGVEFPFLNWIQAEERELRSDNSTGYGVMTRTLNSYCFKPIVSGNCSSSGTVADHPTRITRKVEFGTGIGNFGGGVFWGDATSSAFGQTGDYTEQKTDYSNIPASWLLGFPDKQVLEHGKTGASESTTTEFSRDSATSNKIGVVHYFPGDAEYDRTITLGYDTDGNLTSTNDTGVNQVGALSSLSNYVDRRYPQTHTNAKSQATSVAYDLRFGAADSVNDPNPSVPATTATYDEFGRILQQTAEDGTVATNTYSLCTTGCSAVTWATPRLKVTTTFQNNSVQVAPTQVRYFDTRGLLLLADTEAFSSSDGQSRVEYHYTDSGVLEKQSLPYFSTGGSPKYVEHHYDHKGRVVYTKKPDASNLSRDIEADAGQGGHVNIVDTESGTGRAKRYRFNKLGQLADTTDGYGSSDAVTTSYTYTVRGLLDTVTVDGDLVTDVGYEGTGKPALRTSLWESNSGTTTFNYYSNLLLEESTNSKSNVTYFKYDELARPTERRDGYGTGSEVLNQWVWDTTGNGVGSLKRRSTTVGGVTIFEESYQYDTAGRPYQTTSEIALAGFPGNGSYIRTDNYDSSGRLTSIDYPNSTSTNVYSSKGYLYQVKSGATVLHEYTDVDAFGNVVGEDYANGLYTTRQFDAETGGVNWIRTGTGGADKSIQDLAFEWNTDGSLHKRKDHRGTSSTSDDLLESFGYDSVGRLTSSGTLPGSRDLSFAYDDHGNLTTKTSDIGGDLDVTGMLYNATGKPHRLQSATVAGISNVIHHDSTGNITRYDAASGDDTYIDINNAEQVEKITVGSSSTTTTPTARDEFWYGPDGQRFLRRATWMDSSTLKTTWTMYLNGGVLERTYPVHDSTVDYHQRVLFTEDVHHRYIKYPGSTADSFEYLHRDHLGSVTVSSNSSATAFRNTDFDPFGMQRDNDWDQDASAAEMDQFADDEDWFGARGFTDHEMLNRTGFVHMNGRIYDSRLGRFVQADPVVGSPTRGDNFNRYAYVLNTPLSATDPSGFDCAPKCDGPNWAPIGPDRHGDWVTVWQASGGRTDESGSAEEFIESVGDKNVGPYNSYQVYLMTKELLSRNAGFVNGASASNMYASIESAEGFGDGGDSSSARALKSLAIGAAATQTAADLFGDHKLGMTRQLRVRRYSLRFYSNQHMRFVVNPQAAKIARGAPVIGLAATAGLEIDNVLYGGIEQQAASTVNLTGAMLAFVPYGQIPSMAILGTSMIVPNPDSSLRFVDPVRTRRSLDLVDSAFVRKPNPVAPENWLMRN